MLSQRYRSRMLSGLWWTLGGIAATVVSNLIFSGTGSAYFVVFTGAIVIGIFTFLSGLVGWLWNMD